MQHRFCLLKQSGPFKISLISPHLGTSLSHGLIWRNTKHRQVSHRQQATLVLHNPVQDGPLKGSTLPALSPVDAVPRLKAGAACDAAAVLTAALVEAGATPKFGPVGAICAGALPSEPRLKFGAPVWAAPPKLKPPAAAAAAGAGCGVVVAEPNTNPAGVAAAAAWVPGTLLFAPEPASPLLLPSPKPPVAAGAVVAPEPPKLSLGALPLKEKEGGGGAASPARAAPRSAPPSPSRATTRQRPDGGAPLTPA